MAAPTTAPAGALRDRYVLERELGRGGSLGPLPGNPGFQQLAGT